MSAADPPPQNPAGMKDGESLSTILDASQRAELTQLLATIIESMRTNILNSFDAKVAVQHSLHPQGLSEEQKRPNAPPPPTTDAAKLDSQRELQAELEMQLGTYETKLLKTDALAAFDQWSKRVFHRIGEVVNSPETVKKQAEGAAGEVQASAPYSAPETTGAVMDISENNPGLRLKDVYHPVETPLTSLSTEQRNLILHSVLLLLLSLEQYSANSRVLLLNLTSSLKLSRKTLEDDENTTAKGLLAAVKELSAEKETKEKAEASKESRKWKVGLASVAGAAVIGITGGLAAPLVAAGLGSVLGGIGLGATAAAGYLGTLAGSTILVGGLFGAYGGKMTGKMMEKYSKEVDDFEFLPVHTNKKTSEEPEKAIQQASDHDHKLRVTIGISGWLTTQEEVVKPWRVMGTTAEVFALKYELEALMNLGNAMKGVIGSAVWGQAKVEIIKRTMFSTLASALWPLALLRVGRVVDNPFRIAKTRSDKAGEVLADALINRAQGERPVTLIGYSLGARVIYTCLKKLAERKAFGIVENAVLIGSPTPSDTTDWRILRTAVSGRLVNVFSENDYILGFMYRTSSIQLGIAGLQKIDGLPGIENVDASADVDGHLRYRHLVGGILKKIGFEDIDMTAVEEETAALQKIIQQEKENSLSARADRFVSGEKAPSKEEQVAAADKEAAELEKQVNAQTEKNMMDKVSDFFYPPSSSSSSDKKKDGSKDQSFVGFVSSIMPSMASLGLADDEPSDGKGQPRVTGYTRSGYPIHAPTTAQGSSAPGTSTQSSTAASGTSTQAGPAQTALPRPGSTTPKKEEQGFFAKIGSFLPEFDGFADSKSPPR